jgi:hypothetical protein
MRGKGATKNVRIFDDLKQVAEKCPEVLLASK